MARCEVRSSNGELNIGINDYTPAVNVTPPQSVCTVYFRPMPEQDPEILMQRAETVAQNLGLEFERFDMACHSLLSQALRSSGKPLNWRVTRNHAQSRTAPMVAS